MRSRPFTFFAKIPVWYYNVLNCLTGGVDIKHLIVVNPKAFIKKSEMLEVIDEIRVYFERGQKAEFMVHVSRYPRDAVNVIRKLITNTKDTVRVYSVGGDGILFDCLNGVARLPNAELAVMPYGTSNDFVRSFGENNQALFRDISKQATAGVIPTDVIHCGNRFALNFCTVGIESGAILKYYDIRKKYEWMGKRFGGLVYLLGGILAAMDKKLVNQEYELVIDGETYNGRYATICIANNCCYGGNKYAAPDADPTDGLLDVMLVKSANLLSLMLMIQRYTKGKYYKYPDSIKHLRAKEITVRSPNPLYLDLDGEAYYDTQINASVIASAINIVAVDGLEYQRRSVK